jgi:hypothetical protein
MYREQNWIKFMMLRIHQHSIFIENAIIYLQRVILSILVVKMKQELLII